MAGAIFGLFLIVAHNAIKGRRSDTADAMSLGVAGLGCAAGLKLIVVSLGTLAYEGPAGPFSEDDLGLIAISGAILVLASYKGITHSIFHSCCAGAR